MIKTSLRISIFIFMTCCTFVTSAQDMYTFAGVAGPGNYSGDGSHATIANLYGPTGLATDRSGNIYIADTRNNVIRMVNTSGIISTVAGNAALGGGYTGDGGPATSAQLMAPEAVAVDPAGNLYIADSRNNVIRMVNTSGIINTIAGNNVAGYSGDGGAAVAAQLFRPLGIAVDRFGDIFIADTRNQVIRAVDTSGNIYTIAGNNAAGPGYSGDGGTATSAQLSNPQGISLDTAGNLYIADSRNNVIRMVSATNVITTVAGNNATGPGYSGDGGLATAASLTTPSDVKVFGAGRMLIVDRGNSVVRYINAGDTISTYAGNGTPGYRGDGGLATAAELDAPFGLAIDTAHNVYISCSADNVIRRVGAAVTGITIRANTSDTVCFGTLLRFIATPIADDSTPHYQWLVNAVAAGSDSAVFTPSGFARGDLINCILLDAHGDTLAISGTLRIDSLPVNNAITGPSSYCTGSGATLRHPGGGGGTWVSTDTLVATVAGGLVTTLTSGTDTIYYIATNVCGTDSASIAIVVGPNPFSHISGPDSFCAGSTVMFTDSSAGGQWVARPGRAGVIDSLTGVFTAGFRPGRVVIAYGVAGCYVTDTVKIIPMPMVAPISGPALVDSGNTITLTDFAPAGTWSSSNTAIATVDPMTGIVYGKAIGTDTITYSVTNLSGCTADTTYVITVVSTTGVATVTNSSFRIFPNPATNTVNLSWAYTATGIGTVNIADVSGKTVLTSTIDMRSANHTALNISSLNVGIYIISVQAGSSYYYTKLVVGDR